MSSALFTPLFFPNIAFFKEMMGFSDLFYNIQQGFSKQSFLNRTYILTANGTMRLVVPVQGGKTQMSYPEVKIIYREQWQRQHLRSIETAYRKSAYFEHYMPMLRQLYAQNHKFLVDFNLAGMEWLLSQLGISSWAEWKGQAVDADFRKAFHPKQPLEKTYAFTPYFQVFNDRMPFQENLSTIDLLFNMGSEARNYLK